MIRRPMLQSRNRNGYFLPHQYFSFSCRGIDASPLALSMRFHLDEKLGEAEKTLVDELIFKRMLRPRVAPEKLQSDLFWLVFVLSERSAPSVMPYKSSLYAFDGLPRCYVRRQPPAL